MPLPEKKLIAEIRRMATARGRGRLRREVIAGIGDDCAVLRIAANEETLVTTDFCLEGIHFRREWHSAEVVGHRCLARGLSDIAAMGGRPVAVFLSLALPRDLPQAWVTGFMRGLTKLARRHAVTLAGGDTAQSPDGVLADIIVVGAVPRGTAILRSGARPGDRIYVSGALGGSAATLEELRRRKKIEASDDPRHFHPEPRVELGRALREKRFATAMIDTSDGLSTDLAHLCEESGVGAEIDAASIPRARVGKSAREVDPDLALHGGEDYELLFTSPREKNVPRRIAGVDLTLIGHVTRQKTIFLTERGCGTELKPHGWEHFRQES